MKTETTNQLIDYLKECEEIIDDSYLTTKDARKIMGYAYKVIVQSEEVRKARDKWRAKYEQKDKKNK